MYEVTWSTHYSCQILIKLEFSTHFKKNPQIPNSVEIHRAVAEMIHDDKHTDNQRHDEARQSETWWSCATFHNFVNTPKYEWRQKAEPKTVTFTNFGTQLFTSTQIQERETLRMNVPVPPFPQPAWIHLREEIYSSFILSLPVKLTDRRSVVKQVAYNEVINRAESRFLHMYFTHTHTTSTRESTSTHNTEHNNLLRH
jgi:hypothetical protein